MKTRLHLLGDFSKDAVFFNINVTFWDTRAYI